MSERSRRERGDSSVSTVDVSRDIYTRINVGEEDDEYWISSVLRCLIQNENRMELEKLQKKVEEEQGTKYPDFEIKIRRYSNIFRIEESDLVSEGEEEEGVLRDIIVSGKTEVRLCEKHCSKAGSCSSGKCNSLHMCRFYILNECLYDQCLFGHEIRNPHNVHVLRMHLLHALGSQDVGYLLRDARNRNETTMPTICHFYNVKKGCSRDDCQFLHLCKRFVEEDCKFGLRCKRSHNYFDEQPAQVFKRYGILKNDVEKVMELIRKIMDKNTSVTVATGMKQTRYITPISFKYLSSQIPSNRCFANEKEAALEKKESFMRSGTSCIDAPGRITEEIYTRSLSQSDNSYRSDDELGADTYNREDSRHVVIDKPKYCYEPSLLNIAERGLVPSDSKPQQNETHENHMRKGTHFEDISSDEDDEPQDPVATTFIMQEPIPLETSNVCSTKETQKNKRNKKSQSWRLVQTINNKETQKPSCPKSSTVSSESATLKYETMGCLGIETKLENQTNENQIKSKPKKRAYPPTTDKNDEEKKVSAKILNSIIDLIDTEGTLAGKEEEQNKIHEEDTASNGSKSRFQKPIPTCLRIFKSAKSNNLEQVLAADHVYKLVAVDHPAENSEKPGATNFALNEHIHNSEGSKKIDSVEGCAFNSLQEIQDTHAEDSRYTPEPLSDAKLENVEETPPSSLTNEDKQYHRPLGKQTLKIERVIVKNGKPQWMCCFVDTWTSLNMDSETQDKLEKSYQLFQQSRQCFVEASESRLHVDFMTMHGKILDNDIEQQGQ